MGADLTQRLQSIGDYDFEHFVADLWERRGWETTVSQASNDAGIDVIARKDDLVEQTLVIQAKRYGPNTSVGGPDIQQYASLKNQVDGADGVVVVTTGPVTSAARDRADDLNVKLIDGDGLTSLVREYDAFDLVSEYAPQSDSDDPARAPGGVTQPSRSPAQSESNPESVSAALAEFWRTLKQEWEKERTKRRREREGTDETETDANESTPHREVYGERIPRTTATYLLYYGVVAWLIATVDIGLFSSPTTFGSTTALLMVTGWVALLVGLATDADTAAQYSEWQPLTWLYAAGFLIPYINVIAGAIYVVSRYAHSAAANGELDLDDYNDPEEAKTQAE